jgi:toxin ParE1/3/4
VQVKLSRRADTDLNRVYRSSAADFGIPHADRYRDGLLASLALITENPYAMRERQFGPRPVRIYRFRAHMIVYEIRDDHVFVIRVLHGHQDLKRHL